MDKGCVIGGETSRFATVKWGIVALKACQNVGLLRKLPPEIQSWRSVKTKRFHQKTRRRRRTSQGGEGAQVEQSWISRGGRAYGPQIPEESAQKKKAGRHRKGRGDKSLHRFP